MPVERQLLFTLNDNWKLSIGLFQKCMSLSCLSTPVAQLGEHSLIKQTGGWAFKSQAGPSFLSFIWVVEHVSIRPIYKRLIWDVKLTSITSILLTIILFSRVSRYQQIPSHSVQARFTKCSIHLNDTDGGILAICWLQEMNDLEKICWMFGTGKPQQIISCHSFNWFKSEEDQVKSISFPLHHYLKPSAWVVDIFS